MPIIGPRVSTVRLGGQPKLSTIRPFLPHVIHINKDLWRQRADLFKDRTVTTMSPSPSNSTSNPEETQTDYSNWSHSDLITRVTSLERQLHAKNASYSVPPQFPPSSTAASVPPSQPRTFDPSKYSTRLIALKFAYLGQNYNGYECANGNTTPLPTIEEVLWKALRKGRLISPPSEEPFEVQLDEKVRMKTPVFLNWEGCQYSKCGRTDRGVSAFGQVVGLRVRSNRPASKLKEARGAEEAKVQRDTQSNGLLEQEVLDALPGDGSVMEEGFGLDSEEDDASFHPIDDELPYLSILNNILPRDIRALAWCPNPPEDFDARFSCGQRRYKYFFTNPAFLPTPGPTGMRDQDGNISPFRTGYLDIEVMKQACAHFVGLHDFRNFCRIDESKQMSSCERRVLHATIEEVPEDGPQFLAKQPECAGRPGVVNGISDAETERRSDRGGPKVYCFTVHGTAFLWHQIRCMVAVLFLVGQRLENSSVVKELLDIKTNPCRPTYDMASDAPLVLWDCLFPDQNSSSEDDSLDWVYAGDARSLEALNTNRDGKFGLGGTVDEIWKFWRKRKIDEVLAATLLDLVAGQGDGTALLRGGSRTGDFPQRSQKLFDGANAARYGGRYIPVMQKPKMDTLEVQNARYKEGKGARKAANRKETETSDD